MLGHFPVQPANADPAVLIPWLKETVLSPKERLTTEIQVKERGNILHVLCESAQETLPRDTVLIRLVRSLTEPAVKSRLEQEFPQIHLIHVYSRQVIEARPGWSAPIYLNRLEHYLERLVQDKTDDPVDTDDQPDTGSSHTLESSHSVKNEAADPLAQAAETSAEISPAVERARQGDSAAIARYLGETLSALNVGVEVSARVVPGRARRANSVVSTHSTALPKSPLESQSQTTADHPADHDPTAADSKTDGKADSNLVSRLWIFCEASYSPDPLLIAEPIAQRLRQLQLHQFQDAVITIQVTGEAASDWRLRVDLTPPGEMLRRWARWGDLPAISRLVNQVSKRYGLKLVAEIKKVTLHLISYSTNQSTDSNLTDGNLTDGTPKIDIATLVSDISQLLWTVAPQGLHRAMLYGPSSDDISPEWLRGIDLPAMQQPALSQSAASLAAEGNMLALAYCLTRSLNPDIEDQLATGGIRVQLLLKDKLLHIMADGPLCPPKHVIVPLVSQTLNSVDSPEIEGMRLYGRRAGQKQPIWSHAHDYVSRQRLVPEAKPEFAASDAYTGELITSVSEESLTDLSVAPEQETSFDLGAVLVQSLQRLLIRTQAFMPDEDKDGLPLASPSVSRSSSRLPTNFQSEGGKIALIFGAVGLLLAVQFDFMVGQALRQAAGPAVRSLASEPSSSSAGAQSETQSEDRVASSQPNSFRDELANLNWGEDSDPEDASDQGFWNQRERFDRRDFTTSAIDDDELIYSPQQDFVSTASLLAGSPLPTFRSQQLDEKLALYRQRVAQSGPPDVLVIGSSRALRGVDPAALRQALGDTGYEGLSVFNFGVNGATAQVVDLIVRRLIEPDHLPQVVVWADGARAFNSGRTDVTYNAIAVSDGYQQLEASQSADGSELPMALDSLADQLSLQAQTADRQLSEALGQASSAYTHRGKIRSAIARGLKHGFGAITPDSLADTDSTQAGDTPTGAPTETSLIDLDGFLALSTRFNPATYYQNHAHVAGDYDGDYKDFRLEGQQTEALDQLLSYSAEKSLPIVFINTPLTDEYLDSSRTKSEEAFQQYMLQTAARSSVMTFRDLSQLWPQRYDYFSDPSHLNRYGAYQVSSRIAQDPLIPWPDAPITESQ